MMERAKQTKQVLNELTDCYAELHRSIKTTAQTTAKTKKLWREGNKSRLIKIGVACIVFPDPSPVTEIIGAGFLVAGAVQMGIQKRTLYLCDLKKSLEGIQRDLSSAQLNVRT